MGTNAWQDATHVCTAATATDLSGGPCTCLQPLSLSFNMLPQLHHHRTYMVLQKDNNCTEVLYTTVVCFFRRRAQLYYTVLFTECGWLPPLDRINVCGAAWQLR